MSLQFVSKPLALMQNLNLCCNKEYHTYFIEYCQRISDFFWLTTITYYGFERKSLISSNPHFCCSGVSQSLAFESMSNVEKELKSISSQHDERVK